MVDDEKERDTWLYNYINGDPKLRKMRERDFVGFIIHLQAKLRIIEDKSK